MLVLTRRLGESLLIGDNIKITVEKISNSKIRNKY
jgi:carbon storage regulator CsrA